MYVPLCAPPYPTRTKTASFRLVSFVLRRAILARSNHWSLPTIALEMSLVDEEENKTLRYASRTEKALS